MANLVIAFVASLALNSFLGLSWWKSHDALVAEKARTSQAEAVATTCNDRVDALQTLADKRKVEGDKLRTTAAAKARTSEQRADFTLGMKPKFPNDACASLQSMGDEWLKGRAAK